MPSATQKKRLIGINTPLGADILLLNQFTGSEGLGRLFSFDLGLLSEKKHDIDLNKIVGQSVTVRLQLQSGGERYFNGIVSSFVQTAVGRIASDETYSSYRATVVPWLWLLTRTANCRIFQDLTVPDIIKKIFSEYGFGGLVEDKLTLSYPVWEYCVQYRETAFNFVSRLMEQEGIYYYFTHADGQHMLVLCDSPGAHQPYPGHDSIPFRPTREKATPAGYIQDWSIGKTLQPVKFTHTDYNFKKPRTPMLEDPFAWPFCEIQRDHQHADFEVFDYPGEFRLAPDGEQYAKTRIEELQAQHEIGAGSGDTRGIAPGYTFALKNNLRGDQNRPYLVVAASYTATVSGYAAGDADGEDEFSCSFSAIPAETPYRAPRNTPKPTIQGAQTAIVVGPPGEEIYTDQYGRVKVQFHWDREHSYGPDSSCWIRVAQNWAGKKWGMLFTPRIAHEVIVEFLEGDPDRPIITGRVYNADHIPPYVLPDNKTMSTIKSLSSKGGNGFNELRFEDKKGGEQIFIHGEKDEDVRIKNDAREWIGHERHLIIKKNQFELVEKDKHSTVKGDRLSLTKGDRGDTVEGDQSASIVGSDHLTVGGDQFARVNGDIHLTGDKNINSKAGQNLSLTVGQDFDSKAGMNYAVDAGQAIHIKAGMTVVIEAGVQLSLKAGGNFVDIGPAGVAIKGTMVMINSGGAAGSGGGSSPTAPMAPQKPDVPEYPKEASDATPGEQEVAKKGPKPPKPTSYSPSALVMKAAAEEGTPFCEVCEEAKKSQAAQQ